MKDSTVGFIILIISGVVIIPLVVSMNQEQSNSFNRLISEDTVFDPLCLTVNKNSTNTLQQLCLNQGGFWFMELGPSTDTEFNDNSMLSKILFMKINMTEIPKDTLFTQVNIENAVLEIGSLYPSIKFTEKSDERFFITYGACPVTLWNETSNSNDLPCVNEYKQPNVVLDSYYGILNPERVTKLNFDLSSHVTLFRENNFESFSELIIFSAGSFTGDNELISETKQCLNDAITSGEKKSCLKKSEILIHSSEFGTSGFRPQLNISYKIEPTVIAKSLNTVVFTVYPIIASFLIYVRNQEKAFQSKMRRICDSLIKEIQDTSDGLKNGVDGEGKPETIKSIDFNSNYNPIIIKLSKPISDLYLFTEAYKGILNSGSFENFNKDNQILITKLYNDIFEYNKILEIFYKSIEDARLVSKTDLEMPDFIWGLRTNLIIYLTHLAGLRAKIIDTIERTEGVLDVLNKEKEQKF